MDIETVRKLCRVLDQNPVVGFDAREIVIYPMLDQIFFNGQLLEVELQNGLRLQYAYRTKIAKEILLRELEFPTHVWEPMTTKVVEFAISSRSGSVLIGGAYFGDHALTAAHQIRAMGRSDSVVCVEPNNESRALLLRNAEVNGLSAHICVADGVLWSTAGLPFVLDDRDSHAAATPQESGNFVSQTIDEIVKSNSQGAVALILLDIEGAEEQALAGAESTLSLPPQEAPVVIAEIHRHYVDWSLGLGETSLVQLLKKNDYVVYALRDCQANWELNLDRAEIVPLEEAVLDGPPHGFNLVASKNHRFFDAARFNIVRRVSPKYLRHKDPLAHAPLAHTPL